MKRPIQYCLAIFCLATAGCLYTNIHVPRAYRSATPTDVKASAGDAAVTGKACYRCVLFMVAWGDGGYAAATRDAIKDKPGAILYDVKADVRLTSALAGIYSQTCTVVTGRVGNP